MKLKIFVIFIIICNKNGGQSDGLNLNLPQIQTENVQLTTEDNKKYTLSLILPNSERMETIYFEPSNGELTVKGSIRSYYPDVMANLIVDYVADKNGCRASYKIVQTLPSNGVAFETRLSASDLKGLAG